jgi:hypothetical protein
LLDQFEELHQEIREHSDKQFQQCAKLNKLQ